MEDSPEQTGARSIHAAPPAELNERLLRRLIEPAGVIDVRYAQQKYERFMEWLDKRWALLNQLQARYVDNSADDHQPLVMQRQFGEPVNFYSTTVQTFPTVEQSLSTAERSVMPAASEQSFASAARPIEDSPSHAGGEFRVSRRRAPFNPGSDPTDATPAQLPLVARPASSGQAAREPSSSEVVAARGAQENYEQSESAASINTERLAAAREVAQATPPDDLPGSALPLTKPQLAPRLSKQQERAAPPDEQSPASDFVKEHEQSAGDGPSHDNRRAVAVEVVPMAKADAAPHSSLPLPEPRPLTPPPTERKGTVATEREAVVAAELTESLFTQARPEIVWRKSSGGSPETVSVSRERAGNLTSEAPRIERPSSNTLRPQAATTERSAPAQAQSQRGEIGIEQLSPQVVRAISEKVMRAISLDLAVEFERRGLKKWR